MRMFAKVKEATKSKVVKNPSEMMRETASNNVRRTNPEMRKPQDDFKSHGAVDDFLRSVLGRVGLCQTLRSFEAEWYGSAQKQMVQDLQMADLPRALKHHQLLQQELQRARTQKQRLSEELLETAACFMVVQREKDFHQLQYRQDFTHKNTLRRDISLLKKHIAPSEWALQQIGNKYQTTLKQKMLLSIEKNRNETSKEVRMNQK